MISGPENSQHLWVQGNWFREPKMSIHFSRQKKREPVRPKPFRDAQVDLGYLPNPGELLEYA